MEPREAFKAGFLLRCAEEGLGPDQAEARARDGLAKLAGIGVVDLLRQFGSLAAGAGGSAAGLALMPFPLAAGAGALGGAATGYVGAKMLDPGYDADDLKRQELVAAYNQTADDMESRKG